MKQTGMQLTYFVVVSFSMWGTAPVCGTIMNFNDWTLVQDPPHANLSSSVDSGSQVTLRATAGPIPVGTDIGFQSVNSLDVAASTSGWAFDPAFDFSIAADFALAFSSPTGGFSIGLGIGEDRDGTDSAGVVLSSLNGGSLFFAGAGRSNDIDAPPVVIGVPGQATGRFIVAYAAGSGDVTLGVSTDGDDTPEGQGTFSAIQNSWDDESLLVSFFARADNGVASWNSGTADATFTNFHVISGSPFAVSAVPEPSSVGLLSAGFLLVLCYRRRRRNRYGSPCGN